MARTFLNHSEEDCAVCGARGSLCAFFPLLLLPYRLTSPGDQEGQRGKARNTEVVWVLPTTLRNSSTQSNLNYWPKSQRGGGGRGWIDTAFSFLHTILGLRRNVNIEDKISRGFQESRNAPKILNFGPEKKGTAKPDDWNSTSARRLHSLPALLYSHAELQFQSSKRRETTLETEKLMNRWVQQWPVPASYHQLTWGGKVSNFGGTQAFTCEELCPHNSWDLIHRAVLCVWTLEHPLKDCYVLTFSSMWTRH